MQSGLNAAFQDLLRLRSVGHGPRELKGAHHEAEDGGRAAAARCCIYVSHRVILAHILIERSRKQCALLRAAVRPTVESLLEENLASSGQHRPRGVRA